MSNSSDSKLSPHSQRIKTLDILRGFAMLGIFISIVGSFNSSLLYGHRLEIEKTSLDQFIGMFHSVFINLRFIGIFSLLFGIGIAVQEKSCASKGIPFFPHYSRRTLGLAILGALVISFIFHAEILLAYAILGFLTLCLVRINLKFAIFIAILSIVVYGSIFEITARELLLAEFKEFRKVIRFPEFLAAYQSGPFLTQIKVRWMEYLIIYADNGFHMGTSLGMMILGYAIAIKDLHQKFIANLSNYARWFGISSAITLVFGLYFFVTDQTFFLITEKPVGSLLWSLFQVSSTFTYIYAICWIAARPSLKLITQLFANNGRMSLTTYVGGALLFSLVFYHPGLGLYTKYGTTIQTTIALGAYLIMTLFSCLWLKRFHHGPLEWVLRKFTYWKSPHKVN